jgi:nitrite reductase/ring-hydroxylating ferredoxin subunit/Fe-S cluster biogenesis protein NfuA
MGGKAGMVAVARTPAGAGAPDGGVGPSLAKLLADLGALENLAAHWPEEISGAVNARCLAIDELNAEAFRRLIRQLKSVPGFAAALKAAAADEVVYAVLRRHGILKPSLFERVEMALVAVRPLLAGHGGDVELVAVEPPVAELRFLGACDGCPASTLTFYAGVKKAIEESVPEITDIRQVKGSGAGHANAADIRSPFARDWRFALAAGELAEGGTRFVELGTRSLILHRANGRVACFENACAHMGMAFDGAEVADGVITCPFHGFQYALESGECLTAPEVQLQAHEARILDGRIEVSLGA